MESMKNAIKKRRMVLMAVPEDEINDSDLAPEVKDEEMPEESIDEEIQDAAQDNDEEAPMAKEEVEKLRGEYFKQERPHGLPNKRNMMRSILKKKPGAKY